jgi:hypothetical protein
MMVFLPLGFFGGYIPSWILKKLNLLRVPPEVELEGLDAAEFQADFYPEFERPPEVIIEPDGSEVISAPILLEGYRELVTTNGDAPARRPRDAGLMAQFVLSIVLLVTVFGLLGGWAFREDRRRRRAEEI